LSVKEALEHYKLALNVLSVTYFVTSSFTAFGATICVR